MPTYQYICTDCGTPLEAVQSFSDSALTTCPVCSGRLRKVFSAVGVVFKGSGFYRTDSRDNGKAKQVGVSGESGSGAKESSSDGTSATGTGAAPEPTKEKAAGAAAGKPLAPASAPGSGSPAGSRPGRTPTKPAGGASSAR